MAAIHKGELGCCVNFSAQLRNLHPPANFSAPSVPQAFEIASRSRVLGKFTEIRIYPILECNISLVRNADRRLHANAAGIHIEARAFYVGVSLGNADRHRAVFDEIFTSWRVPFLLEELGTIGVRSSMSAPSPVISRIRSSVIQMGLESALSAGFPFRRNSDWRYSLENSWAAQLKVGIWDLGGAAMPETSISMKWTPPGSRMVILSLAGGWIEFRTAPEEPSVVANFGIP